MQCIKPIGQRVNIHYIDPFRYPRLWRDNSRGDLKEVCRFLLTSNLCRARAFIPAALMHGKKHGIFVSCRRRHEC